MATPPVPRPADVVLQHCQSCGMMRATKLVTFRRNVGMLFLRRTYKINGYLCKGCVNKYFWSFQGKNLVLGPWGTISLFVMPTYLIMNSVAYGGALIKLRESVARMAMPPAAMPAPQAQAAFAEAQQLAQPVARAVPKAPPALPPQLAKSIFCTKCGAKVEAGTRFCVQCGAAAV